MRMATARQVGVFTFEDIGWLNRNGEALLSSDPLSETREKLIINVAKPPDDFDFLQCSVVDFVSRRLVAALRGNINAEFLEFIAMVGHTMMKDPGYMMLHLLDRFEAVDIQRSDVEMWGREAGGGIKTIHKLFLRWDVVAGSEAFALIDANMLCVSTAVKDRILASGAKGITFTRLDAINADF